MNHFQLQCMFRILDPELSADPFPAESPIGSIRNFSENHFSDRKRRCIVFQLFLLGAF